MTNVSKRPRRLRASQVIRDLIADVTVGPNDFVAPLFIKQNAVSPVEIRSMPGIYQHTLESLLKEADRLFSFGVRSFMIFGIPTHKDPLGSQAYARDGITQVAISTLKQHFGGSVVVMADLCLDEFTDHGHCGILDKNGYVDNDATLELYGEMALAQAGAGVDFVGPSGMMDSQVGAIRNTLDNSGFKEVGIIAYSVKYASSYYGPFRDAVDVCIADGGDRKTYQQDFKNSKDAIVEVELDITEGADIVMVKPAGAYLDVLARIRDRVDVPIAAYQVSGEYSMIKAANALGYLDGNAVALEQLYAIKRAGADLILSYFAHELPELLGNSL